MYIKELTVSNNYSLIEKTWFSSFFICAPIYQILNFKVLMTSAVITSNKQMINLLTIYNIFSIFHQSLNSGTSPHAKMYNKF